MHAYYILYLIYCLIMNIIILAAGTGKRMASTLPKVLHPLAGKPLLAHVIDTAKILKPTKLCVIYGYGGNIIPNTFADTNLVFIKQDVQLGTGHAVAQAINYLDNSAPTLILYGDVPMIKVTTLQELIKQAGQNKFAIITIRLKNPTGYGRIIRKQKKIVRIVEQKDASIIEQKIQEINTGIFVIPTTKLSKWLTMLTNNNAQGEYYLTDIISHAITDKTEIVSIQPSDITEMLGVNSKIQLAKLERLYQKRIALTLMQQGVTLLDPNRLDIRGFLQCKRDVTIDINCIFEGKVNIDSGAFIGANCIIRNTCIGKNVHVEPFSYIDGAHVGITAKIGPYARLRPGTKLNKNARIGNFVEIKNSRIGAHSKINHLAYIGDSIIGTSVNIGAGVITCNYNGHKKFRTIIDDNAFIGSDTQLIAPVHIGKNATIGAGTTLTKDAPENQLTLSRTKQLSFPKWERLIKNKIIK